MKRSIFKTATMALVAVFVLSAAPQTAFAQSQKEIAR